MVVNYFSFEAGILRPEDRSTICALAGPSLTSVRAGCKIKVIFKKFIATPKAIVFAFVL